MNVYDFKVQRGMHRMTIATLNGKIQYVMIDNAHLDPTEFEEMYQRYLDFDEEAESERDNADA